MKDDILDIGRISESDYEYSPDEMSTIEKRIRFYRREKAIQFLESFLSVEDKSQYNTYTYKELLHAVRLDATMEIERIKNDK